MILHASHTLPPPPHTNPAPEYSSCVLSLSLTWRIIFLRTGSSRFHRDVLKRLKCRQMIEGKKRKKKSAWEGEGCEFPTYSTEIFVNTIETVLIRTLTSSSEQLHSKTSMKTTIASIHHLVRPRFTPAGTVASINRVGNEQKGEVLTRIRVRSDYQTINSDVKYIFGSWQIQGLISDW